MKNTCFVLSLSLLFLLSLPLSAQFKGGLRAGFSTFDVQADQLRITQNGDNDLGLAFKEANYNFHGGLWFRFGRTFFIQPEFLLNASEVAYELRELGNISTYAELLEERYLNLDIPVMAGFKLGPIRLNAGPVAHILLNQTTELKNIDGFSQDLRDLTLGYQAGLGIDIGKIVLDFRYEGNLDRFGNHIRIFGEEFAFTDRPGRLMASVGFAF